jgi:hypothetical protein
MRGRLVASPFVPPLPPLRKLRGTLSLKGRGWSLLPCTS